MRSNISRQDRSQTRRSRLALCSALVAIAAAIAGAASDARADSGKLTEIDYMTDPGSTAALQKLVDACSAATGLKIERQIVPYPELIQRVLLAATSKSLPDLILFDNADTPQLAEGGMVVPVADLGLSTEGFVPALIALGTYQGKVYGLPSTVNSVGLFYSVDALKKAGVQPPKTWDELKAAAKILTKGDTYGLAFPAPANEIATFHVASFVWSNGGNFAALNSPQTVGAVDYLAGLVKDGSVSKSAVTWSFDELKDQFVSGRAAMAIMGSWNVAVIGHPANFNYEIVPIPTPTAGGEVKVPGGGEQWGASATADKAAAKKAIACLTTDKNVLQYALDRSNLPTRTAVLDDFKKQAPFMAPFVAELDGIVSRAGELGVKYPKYSSAFSTALQAALIGTKSAQAALDEAQNAASNGQ